MSGLPDEMEGIPDTCGVRPETPTVESSRAARRAAFLEGSVAVTLGAVALALGSNPDQTAVQKGWWLALTSAFSLSVVWVLVRAFGRADEYLRRVQLESMAVAFAAVLGGLQVATVLDAADVVPVRQPVQPIMFGGPAVWLLVADLRTRVRR